MCSAPRGTFVGLTQSHGILQSVLKSRYSFYPHYTDEETGKLVQSNLPRIGVCCTEITKESTMSMPRREHWEPKTVHVRACGCVVGGYLHFRDKKMRNQRQNIVEFSKVEVVLIQGFCRSKFPHPTEIQ